MGAYTPGGKQNNPLKNVREKSARTSVSFYLMPLNFHFLCMFHYMINYNCTFIYNINKYLENICLSNFTNRSVTIANLQLFYFMILSRLKIPMTEHYLITLRDHNIWWKRTFVEISWLFFLNIFGKAFEISPIFSSPRWNCVV